LASSLTELVLRLQGEWYMTTPQECRVASFTPSFNVTFGLFTCADLIYTFPAATMAEQGIKHFLMPAAWTDEMSQMQVMAFAQGWSLEHNVTLVLSNLRTKTGHFNAMLTPC